MNAVGSYVKRQHLADRLELNKCFCRKISELFAISLPIGVELQFLFTYFGHGDGYRGLGFRTEIRQHKNIIAASSVVPSVECDDPILLMLIANCKSAACQPLSGVTFIESKLDQITIHLQDAREVLCFRPISTTLIPR